MITRKSTIDQHQGTHPGTGLRITQLVEVETEYDLDASDPEEHAWVDEVHAARVALESLDSEARARAQRWLDEHSFDFDVGVAYRRAIAAVTPNEEQIAAMVAACPWSLVRQGDRWYARKVARATADDEPGSPADEADDERLADIREALPTGWIARWTGDEGDVVIEWAPEGSE